MQSPAVDCSSSRRSSSQVLDVVDCSSDYSAPSRATAALPPLHRDDWGERRRHARGGSGGPDVAGHHSGGADDGAARSDSAGAPDHCGEQSAPSRRGGVLGGTDGEREGGDDGCGHDAELTCADGRGLAGGRGDRADHAAACGPAGRRAHDSGCESSANKNRGPHWLWPSAGDTNQRQPMSTTMDTPQRRVLESTRATVSQAKSKLSQLQATIDQRLMTTVAANADLRVELTATQERLRSAEEKAKVGSHASSHELAAMRQEAASFARRAQEAEDRAREATSREAALLERSDALERRVTQAEQVAKQLAQQAEARAALSNAALEAEADSRRATERSLGVELAAAKDELVAAKEEVAQMRQRTEEAAGVLSSADERVGLAVRNETTAREAEREVRSQMETEVARRAAAEAESEAAHARAAEAVRRAEAAEREVGGARSAVGRAHSAAGGGEARAKSLEAQLKESREVHAELRRRLDEVRGLPRSSDGL